MSSGRELPQRHPNAPAPGEEIASHNPRCFGCGMQHPTGLHMRITAGEGLTAHAEFEVTEHHQGAVGLAHGGLLATAFDEVLGSLNWLLQAPAVTARLETNFKKPVQVGKVLHVDAQIIGQQGRKVFAQAIGHLDGPQGEVAATADALFIQVPLEHFRDHGRKEDVERAEQERTAGAPGIVEVSP